MIGIVSYYLAESLQAINAECWKIIINCETNYFYIACINV